MGKLTANQFLLPFFLLSFSIIFSIYIELHSNKDLFYQSGVQERQTNQYFCTVSFKSGFPFVFYTASENHYDLSSESDIKKLCPKVANLSKSNYLYLTLDILILTVLIFFMFISPYLLIKHLKYRIRPLRVIASFTLGLIWAFFGFTSVLRHIDTDRPFDLLDYTLGIAYVISSILGEMMVKLAGIRNLPIFDFLVLLLVPIGITTFLSFIFVEAVQYSLKKLTR
ncbi:MAG: hypothetical protein US86_C0002G0114 [Candidatus Daviesbacteria bacterium GW2011_GWA2_38_24]|uniref:Uncharacterized protein n=1 Tax=Candidatus Daviesbacteria bacterium GW2011_GWA2_38_24 TaxID=1618422 RepID=A0A0G0JJH3_9BACT|nr:MAG: hypothetical protein US86_C0002G0114 [Candidatus Daviesbacteria bacterium GW2011_GWA2_38_24]KKQ80757.1 MAG: hypothetical protein UT01_C0006G0018 [Candidatus Daviesbacteria bacterium GW2011_GWA1_38_7]OGE22744.1 MAG: hypothetical protein A2688_01365 [Candidatus Daviesbacteria bacterium RIFCSPHIGHO2_01_FULL_38_8]